MDKQNTRESCASCKKRLNLTKFDYLPVGGCKHTKLEGFACMAFANEGEVVWMVGIDENNDQCECYQRRKKKVKWKQ